MCMASVRPSTGIVVRVATGLVREDDRHVEVESDLGRDRGRHGPHVTEETMPAAAMTAREFGPGRRDHSQVDPAAIVIPDPAVHHVGTDRQADAAPRRRTTSGVRPRRKRNASQKTRCLFR